MATSTAECEQMIAASRSAKRKLMIAYRLRYEPFHMTAIELCKAKDFGKLKSIVASNGQNTKAPNIRLSEALGGGPVQDVGIYCLNAARYLTGEEPVEVSAMAHQPKDDPRFREVAESVSFTLRFTSGVIANCDCSFGIGETRSLRVHGANGSLEMENAFAYKGQRMKVRKEDGTLEPKLEEVNHFAAEMDHFAACILKDGQPRTPGEEGLADLRAIAAITEAVRTGKSCPIPQS
jgi:predicted dehydrogenase